MSERRVTAGSHSSSEDMPTELAALRARLRELLDAGTGSAPQLLTIGAQLHSLGEPEAALAAFEAAAERAPERVEAWHAVASLRALLNRPRAALEACNQALRLDPENVDSLFNAAAALEALGDLPAASHAYRRVLEREPSHYGAHLNLPLLLARQGDYPAALELCADGLARMPEAAPLYFNRGELLTSCGDHAGALAAYRRVQELGPGDGRAALAAAVSLAILGRVGEAHAGIEVARREHPASAAAFRSPLLADIQAAFPELDAGRIAVVANFERQCRCEWTGRDAATRLFADLIRGEAGGPPIDNPDLPFLGLGLPLPEDLRRQLASRAAARVAAAVAGRRLVKPPRRSSGRLRIGYVSGDIRPHPVASLAGPLFGRHDRQGFEVFIYSTGPGEGTAERARIAAAADVFCDAMHYDGPALAQRIATDRIDILVDLSGYTLHARTTALALRPAPVQVSYLGYLGSMGADWVDYALLDRQVMTAVERPAWSEAIAYLPHSLFPCDGTEAVDSAPLRSACGLPETGVVFACFNAAWKIDPASFGLWMEVLREVDGAVLWLVDDAPEMAANLRREAEARGVAGERLVFAPRVARPDYLARLSRADVFLDTLAYNANTTGIDALLAGVPLVSLPGDSVAARGAGSLLAAHGLPELVAGSMSEYVALAVRLAKDVEFRERIKEKVRRRESSHLFCIEQRVRDIERAYVTMWERYQAGLAPADFDVALPD